MFRDYANRNLHTKTKLPRFLVNKHFMAIEVFVLSDKEKKILKAGTVYPTNDSAAEGIVLKDYDITYSDRAVSIIKHGVVIEESLPQKVSDDAKNVLKQIYFI